jgi:1,5-anhydro-D-fructose reductase (1,5-anhydro-D-mannitol-forming)
MKIGIIGYGKMGKLRHHLLEKIGKHSVMMVCDPVPQNGDFIYTTDPKDVLINSDIGVVFICTPNYLIKDFVVQSLENGKHVFSEKPPGVSSWEVREMMDEEKRNPGLKLMFGFNHRYHESVIEAKKRIDSGEFGRILWMRGRYGKSVDEKFFDNWRASKDQAGGGILMDQGIHMLDLLMLFADGFDQVKSFCSNVYWNLDVEDNVFALLKNSKNNIVASLHSTMTQWRHLFALEIFLERGYMVINGLITSSMSYTTPSGKEVLTIATNRTPPPQAKHASEKRFVYSEDSSWQAEMSDFFQAIQTGAPIPSGTTKESFELMQMIERIYKDGGCHGGPQDSASAKGVSSCTLS